MNSTFIRFVCRMLITSIIALPLQARAGLIGTEQAVSAAQLQVEQAAVPSVVRADVARQLQAFGLSPQEAQARVAALSDAEVAALAGRIDDLPAGGFSIGLVLVVIFLAWRFLFSDQAKAEAAKKSAPAPAPDKK